MRARQEFEILEPRDWAEASNWKEYLSNAAGWVNKKINSWFRAKFDNLDQYPRIIKILPVFLLGLTWIAAKIIAFALVLPVSVAALAMFLYGTVSNGILEVVYNTFTIGVYRSEKNIRFIGQSLFFGERPLVLAHALWRQLSYWPQGFLLKALYLFTVKPIQLVITPVLLGIAIAQELVLTASFGLGMLLLTAPFIIPAITYYVVNLPRAIVNGLKSLCCCKKRNGESMIEQDEGEEEDEVAELGKYPSSVASYFSKKPKATEISWVRDSSESVESSPSRTFCGFRCSTRRAKPADRTDNNLMHEFTAASRS